MSCTPAYIKTLFPEITDSDAFLQAYINIAEERSSSSAFCGNADFACALLTAHLVTSFNSGSGEGKSIEMEKVGDLQRKYARSGNNNEELSSTKYGRQYLSLLKTVAKGPMIIC